MNRCTRPWLLYHLTWKNVHKIIYKRFREIFVVPIAFKKSICQCFGNSTNSKFGSKYQARLSCWFYTPPSKKSPYTWIKCYFYILWSLEIVGFNTLFGNRVSRNPRLGGMRDVPSVIISYDQTQLKLSLLFSNFGSHISNGSLFKLPYNGIFLCRHIFAFLSRKHGLFFVDFNFHGRQHPRKNNFDSFP